MSRGAARLANRNPEPLLPGLIRRPMVAWYGLASVLSRATAAPRRPRRYATGADPPACLEHLYTRHLPGPACRQVEPLPRTYRAVDHPDVGNLLPAGPALDLEYPTRRRSVRVPVGVRQQRLNPAHEVGDAGACHRRAGEHWVHDTGPGLFRQRRAPLTGGAKPPLDISREQLVVVLGQRRRLPVAEGGVMSVVGPEAGGAASRVGH